MNRYILCRIIVPAGIFALSALILFGMPIQAQAETYRYMDSSGNIHFAERSDQVPPQYRSQVPALITPIVPVDPRTARKLEHEKSRKLEQNNKEKEREKHAKQKELEKLKKKKEKELKKNKKKKGEPGGIEAESAEGDFSKISDPAADSGADAAKPAEETSPAAP